MVQKYPDLPPVKLAGGAVGGLAGGITGYMGVQELLAIRLRVKNNRLYQAIEPE